MTDDNAAVSLAGTKCRRHVDMPALGVCERCGDYICLRCLCDHEGHLYCPDCLAAQPAGAKPSTRVAAHLIDAMTFLVPAVVVIAIAGAATGFAAATRGQTHPPAPMMTLFGLVAACLVMVASIQVFLVHENGQSIGKRVMGLRVVMLNDKPVDVWRVLFLRNLLPLAIGFIPMIGVIFRIANVAALFSDGNRAIHDRFAGTKVIRVNRGPGTTS